MTDEEETDDEFVHGVEQVNDNEDEDMTNAEVEVSRNGDEKVLTRQRQMLERLKNTVKDTTDAEINSLLDIKIQSEVLHIQSLPILTVPVSVISKPTVPTPIPVTPSVALATSFLTPLSVSTIPLVRHQTTTPILTPLIITDAPTITTTISEFDALFTIQLKVAKLEKKSALYHTMHENKSFNRNLANHRLYHALMEALIEDENAMDNGVTDIIKDHKGKHDDDDPLARLNQGPSYDLLKGTCTSNIKLEFNFQECFYALIEKLDWNNPEGDRYPFDLSKPLPLQGRQCRLTIAADYVFNNDLEYLKSFDLKRTYTTSIMKRKAARYEIVGIEYMVLML
nr:hypothetical protein [Tanacetum cinerariifolium]